MSNVYAIGIREAGPADAGLAGFTATWFDQMSVAWRATTMARVEGMLRLHLAPALGSYPMAGFSRSDALALRAAWVRGALGKPALSSARVNALMKLLRQILAERQRQLGVPNPLDGVRGIPMRESPPMPFTLPELIALRDAAPSHLRQYIWIRGLVGLRSGEANGLRWRDVHLDGGWFEVREARVDHRQVAPKNRYSERRLAMIAPVRAAFGAQHALTGQGEFVFTTKRGASVDSRNFAKRDWRRLLRDAGLSHRAPEQLRHTAATLSLAAGEAPTAVARMLGHSDVRMLLTTYARYMPGALGEADGSRLERAVGSARCCPDPAATVVVLATGESRSRDPLASPGA